MVEQGDSIALLQEIGNLLPLPGNVTQVQSFPSNSDSYAGLIVVTDRVLQHSLPIPTAVLRPPSLTLGIASRRGLNGVDLEEAIAGLFARFKLSTLSLSAVGSSRLLAGEAALSDFVEDRQLVHLTYAETILKKSPKPPQGKLAGTSAAAALLSASSKELVVPTTPHFGHFTLAVARRP